MQKKSNIANYYKNGHKTNVIINIYSKKRKDDIINKIIDNLSTRACAFFKNNNIKRKIKHIELIGCNKMLLHLWRFKTPIFIKKMN